MNAQSDEAVVSSIEISDTSEKNVNNILSTSHPDIDNTDIPAKKEAAYAHEKVEEEIEHTSQTSFSQDSSEDRTPKQEDEEEKVLFNVFMDTTDI